MVEGGEGGVGNAALATADCRRTRDYTEGSAGGEKEVNLELKTIADVGMVSMYGIMMLSSFSKTSIHTLRFPCNDMLVLYTYLNFKVHILGCGD